MLAPFVLFVFAIFSVGAIWKPQWALAMLLLLFPLKQSMQGAMPIFVQNQALANYLVGAVVLVSLAFSFFRGKLKTAGYFNPMWIAMFAGYVYSFLSIMWSPSKDNALFLVQDGLPYLVMYIFIAPMLLGNLKDWNQVLIVMAVFGCLTAIFILVSPEFNLKGGRLGMDFSAKIRSSPLAIGELGGFLLLVAPLLVLPRRKLWIDAIRVLVLMTGVILSIYSGSRGQFFFAVILALLFFPVSRPVKNIAQFFLLSIGSVILLGAILLVVSFLVGNVDVAQRWLNASENDRAVGIRAANMMDMLEGFFTTPTGWLTGLGLSAFTSLTGSTEPYSHSMFVDCLVEMGLVAFGILIVMLIYSARKCLELIQFSTGHPEDRSAAVVLVALCAYQLLLMNKQGEVWASQNTVVYFLLLAKVVSPPMRDSYERELPEPVADATAHDAEGGALATP